MEQVKRLQTTTRPVNKNKSNIKHMSMIGMMGALSTILMLFDFPVPLAPTFAKMDFSELPIILCGFMYGPLAGITTAVVKIILNFVLNGTDTMGVGELANLIGSVSYLLPSVLIYRKQKGKKRCSHRTYYRNIVYFCFCNFWKYVSGISGLCEALWNVC